MGVYMGHFGNRSEKTMKYIHMFGEKHSKNKKPLWWFIEKKGIFGCKYCMTAVIHILQNAEVLYEKTIHINELCPI